MLELFQAMQEKLMPYLVLLGIALTLSLASMIWYGFYAWHEHSIEHPRKKKHRHRQPRF